MVVGGKGKLGVRDNEEAKWMRDIFIILVLMIVSKMYAYVQTSSCIL